jgi:adenylate cyclase
VQPALHVEPVTERVDIEASGLLDGLEGDARAERAELVAWLLERNFTVDQIREAFAPMLLASRRVLGDDGVYVSAREISAEAAIDLELLQRVQRAMGLPRVDDPDAVVHLRADAEAASHAQWFIELGLDPEQIVLTVRVLAEGLARAAEVMRYAALSAVMKPGATELDIAKGSEAVVLRVSPLLGPMIEEMLLVQLRHAMETEAVNATGRAEGIPLPGARLVTIAFADLVGFTRLGEVVPPEDLEGLAHRLGDLAREVAVPPVRFIKTIGDEVMLVSPDAVALLDAVLDLVDATDADDDGDWFGSSVNLASRVTAVARPGSVLVSESAREAIGDVERFTWSFAGSRHLKGVKDDVKLVRARAAADA